MPAKKYHVYLRDEEREYLERVSTGTDKARRITKEFYCLQMKAKDQERRIKRSQKL